MVFNTLLSSSKTLFALRLGKSCDSVLFGGMRNFNRDGKSV